jgi:2,4-dienoyl-CoA reductase [(3E)-enoyl-CoA-producing], peroxisomal
MGIDVLGSFNLAKLTAPHLLKSIARASSSPTGLIIFISATMHYIGIPLQTHASVAKAVVDALSASMAFEYGPYGLTSIDISLGSIKGTEGAQRLSKVTEHTHGYHPYCQGRTERRLHGMTKGGLGGLFQ